jgi:hypothetical protein
MTTRSKKYLDYRNIGAQMIIFGHAQEDGMVVYPVILNWDYGTFNMIISKENLIYHGSLIREFITFAEGVNLDTFTMDECINILRTMGCEEEYDLTKITDLV